jgi:hypothetical protein
MASATLSQHTATRGAGPQRGLKAAIDIAQKVPLTTVAVASID